jgi:hypothetical protein
MTRTAVATTTSVIFIASFLIAAADASSQYYRRYARVDVERAITQAERTSNEFVHLFDHELDRSVLNGSEREDRLNEKAKDLENRLDGLDKEFHGRENWWESRDTAAVALQYARGINNSMRARRYSPDCERMWFRLRADLNEVARYYDLPRLQR